MNLTPDFIVPSTTSSNCISPLLSTKIVDRPIFFFSVSLSNSFIIFSATEPLLATSLSHIIVILPFSSCFVSFFLLKPIYLTATITTTIATIPKMTFFIVTPLISGFNLYLPSVFQLSFL